MDGRFLAEMFVPGKLEVTYRDDEDDQWGRSDFVFSTDEEEQIKQHLENLGYL
jgi:hypothetical protein